MAAMEINDYRASSGNSRPARLRESERDESLMGSYDSFQAISFRIPPYHPDALIGSKGYKILDDQMNVSSARAPLNILRSAVLAKGVQVHSAVQDQTGMKFAKAQAYAEHLAYDLGHIKDAAGNRQSFRHVLFELLYAIQVGFRCTEIIWRMHEDGPYKGKWGFSRFAAKPAQQIGFDLNLHTLAVNSITSYTPLDGYDWDIPIEKVLLYTFSPKDGLPYGSPVGRTVYKDTWSIDFLTKFWNLALEIFGSPFLLAKAPKGMLKLARQALAEIRLGAPAVLPEGTDAALMQVAAGGLEGFKSAIEWHHQQCSFAYLHNTLSSGEGEHGSTSAGADVHQDTGDYQFEFLRTDIEDVCNFQLAERWFTYNYGTKDMDLMPSISLGDWDPVDSKNVAGMFKTLVDMDNMHPDNPEIREKLKVRPATTEEMKKLTAKRAERQKAQQQKQIGSAPPKKKEKAA